MLEALISVLELGYTIENDKEEFTHDVDDISIKIGKKELFFHAEVHITWRGVWDVWVVKTVIYNEKNEEVLKDSIEKLEQVFLENISIV